MYEAFYGLKTKPFQLNPDPNFYFGSKQHSRARAYLEYGMHQNEGFIVITGEVGAGKTTIVRGLLESLDEDRVLAATLVSTQLEADDTLRLVGAAFGVRTKDASKSDILMHLEAFLIDATSKGKRCMLIVDEAQNLTPRSVEELRMLSNFQFGTRALLQSFLVGQPEFRQILQSPHMEQLRQRVIASCHIGPLGPDETQAYVEHRLKCAGSTGSPKFAAEVFPIIYKASGGIPRRVNTICDRLLLLGFLANKKEFAAADVNEVVHEIQDETVSFGAKPTVPSESQHLSQGLMTDLDIDLSRIDLESRAGEEASQLVASLKSSNIDDRLLRLERSLLRLERINSATLSVLQQLVNAVRIEPSEKKAKIK